MSTPLSIFSPNKVGQKRTAIGRASRDYEPARVYVLDGNSYLHRAFHGYKNRPLTNSRGEGVTVVYGFMQILGADLQMIQPTHVCLCFDGPGLNWRDEMYPEYKANRKAKGAYSVDNQDANMDQQNRWVRQLMQQFGFCVVYKKGAEGDDVVKSAVDAALVDPDAHVIIGARDKDLHSLINERVHIWDAISNVHIKEAEVMKKFGVRPDQIAEYLGLMGDKIDNIPGCPGLGAVTAKKMLTEFNTVKSFMQYMKANQDTCTDKLWVRTYATILKNRDTVKLSLELTKLRDYVDLDIDQFVVDNPTPLATSLLSDIGIRKLHFWFSQHLNHSKVRAIK